MLPQYEVNYCNTKPRVSCTYKIGKIIDDLINGCFRLTYTNGYLHIDVLTLSY